MAKRGYYYVMPAYRAALDRIQQEQQRAERYAQPLRALGINCR